MKTENSFFSFFVNFENFSENPDQPGPKLVRSGNRTNPGYLDQDVLLTILMDIARLNSEEPIFVLSRFFLNQIEILIQ